MWTHSKSAANTVDQDPTITRSFVMSELLTSVAVPWVSEWYLSRVGASDSTGAVLTAAAPSRGTHTPNLTPASWASFSLAASPMKSEVSLSLPSVSSFLPSTLPLLYFPPTPPFPSSSCLVNSRNVLLSFLYQQTSSFTLFFLFGFRLSLSFLLLRRSGIEPIVSTHKTDYHTDIACLGQFLNARAAFTQIQDLPVEGPLFGFGTRFTIS